MKTNGAVDEDEDDGNGQDGQYCTESGEITKEQYHAKLGKRISKDIESLKRLTELIEKEGKKVSRASVEAMGQVIDALFLRAQNRELAETWEEISAKIKYFENPDASLTFVIDESEGMGAEYKPPPKQMYG